MKTLLILLLLPFSAYAQTYDPCATQPTTGKVLAGTVIKARWAQAPADGMEAVTVYQNGVATKLTTLTQIAPAGACGLAGYEVTLGPIAQGVHTFELTAWNRSILDDVAQESPRSDPFVLTVVAPNRPTAPSNVRVGS